MTVVRTLSFATLVDPINDPSDRNVMPMSTLIATTEWLLETSWDGSSIGDVHVFRNMAIPEQRVTPNTPDRWVWWGGVPHGKIKSYRFTDSADLKPRSLQQEFNYAEREGKPGSTGKAAKA